MKKWTRWQDWVGVAAGLYAAIASIWLAGTTRSMTLMMVFGLLMVATAVLSVAMPRLVSMEWALAAAGALLFVSPWIGQYTGYAMSTWVSWICGAVGIAAGLMALAPAMEMRHATGDSNTAH
ncbi:SPW repeat protein [Glutamicibacter sp. NPDC087344]|uniref:SPW repeat domain-containing protein n=1 Tax=Glutamicibacter sp. NPDC087344 TaxID=3363994 RepID=UPI003820519F